MDLPSATVCLGGAAWVYQLGLRRADEWAALLTEEERAHADRFRFAIDRDRNVIGRAASRLAVGKALGIDPREVVFGAGPHGKPCSALKLNVSHSGEWVLLATSKDKEVGVDVELARTDLEVFDIARTVFTEQELALLREAPEQARSRFFRIWARKEAVLKAWGTGFSLDARFVHAGLDRSIVHAPEDRHPPATVEELSIDASHAGAVAILAQPT